MFFRKCKKCGGKLVLVDANIEVDIGCKTQKVKNVPAKQCTECRNLVVDEYVIERISSMLVIIPQIFLTLQNARMKKVLRHLPFYNSG